MKTRLVSLILLLTITATLILTGCGGEATVDFYDPSIDQSQHTFTDLLANTKIATVSFEWSHTDCIDFIIANRDALVIHIYSDDGRTDRGYKMLTISDKTAVFTTNYTWDNYQLRFTNIKYSDDGKTSFTLQIISPFEKEGTNEN